MNPQPCLPLDARDGATLRSLVRRNAAAVRAFARFVASQPTPRRLAYRTTCGDKTAADRLAALEELWRARRPAELGEYAWLQVYECGHRERVILRRVRRHGRTPNGLPPAAGLAAASPQAEPGRTDGIAPSVPAEPSDDTETAAMRALAGNLVRRASQRRLRAALRVLLEDAR